MIRRLLQEYDSRPHRSHTTGLRPTLHRHVSSSDRVTICLARVSRGWINTSPLLKITMKEWTVDFCKLGFQFVASLIQPGSIIVIDIAPYLSRKKDKAPTSTTLTKVRRNTRNIPFGEDLRKLVSAQTTIANVWNRHQSFRARTRSYPSTTDTTTQLSCPGLITKYT